MEDNCHNLATLVECDNRYWYNIRNLCQRNGGNDMKLTKRELAVMRVLWESKEALMISDIAKKDADGTIYSVHRVIRSLLKKGMVVVDGHEYSQKTLARKFRPVVDAESADATAIHEILNSLVGESISASRLLASLLPNSYSEETAHELDRLEEMIEARRKLLLESKDTEGPAKE